MAGKGARHTGKRGQNEKEGGARIEPQGKLALKKAGDGQRVRRAREFPCRNHW